MDTSSVSDEGTDPPDHPLAGLTERVQVVHLKPDDTIVFSNVGYEVTDDLVAQAKEALGGRRVIFFTESVDIAILREIEVAAAQPTTEPARETGTDWLYSVEERKT